MSVYPYLKTRYHSLNIQFRIYQKHSYNAAQLLNITAQHANTQS